METKRKIDVDKELHYPEMYNRFIKEKTPSMCVSGQFDVSRLYRYTNKYSFNAMLCYCVQNAAQNVPAFHYSIKEDGLYYYKNVKTNSVIIGKDGKHYYPDYSFQKTFLDYHRQYLNNNKICYEECKHLTCDDGSLIATSAMISFPFESFSIGLSDTFWDNFLLWGKFKRKGFKRYLNMTLRFHHALIDGNAAGIFFNELQNQINKFNPKN